MYMTKRVLSFGVLASLLFSTFVPGVHAETPKENVIVVFKDDIDQKAVTNVNGEVEETFKNIGVVAGEVPKAAIPLLENDKDVLAVEVDQRVKVNGQVKGWGVDAVNAPAAWESQYTGKGISIAVLDTGIAPHKDLLVTGGISVLPYTKSYYDDNGHGTHVAGIIGAENNDNGIIGIAPEADLYAVKVLDEEGAGYLSDILAGIDWAISNNMDIINLSLGALEDSTALQKAVNDAYQNGSLAVAAAGNEGNADGSGDTVVYPARYDSVIGVSATDIGGNRAGFSATGGDIDVAAPGVDIVSTYLGNGYAVMDGTSMAAPYVAGTLALLKQANPVDTNAELRGKLEASAIDIGAPGKDSFFGYGLVQAPVTVKQEEKTEVQDEVTSGLQTIELSEDAVLEIKQPVDIPFNDINNHWAKNDIITIFQRGWMKGMDNDSFAADESLTRAQAAAILVRALGLEPIQSISSKYPSYADVSKSYWAFNDIEIIKQHGLMKGQEIHKFAPNDSVTREQMAVILDRILEDAPSLSTVAKSFRDVSQDRWSREAIEKMSEQGIFKGFEDNTFRPSVEMTRAQMASILNRISSLIA